MNTDENESIGITLGITLANMCTLMHSARDGNCPGMYCTDYMLDRLWVMNRKPRAFMWILRNAGTHIYALEYYLHGKSAIPPLDDLRQMKDAIIRCRSRGDVKHIYVFYDGCCMEASLEQAEKLIDSYILQRKVYDTPTPPEETGGLPI